jgi:hypothetical protein
MQPFTLNKAAKACHKSKSTLLDAIRSGRMSASRDNKNQWQIQASELFRVYQPTEHLPPEQNRDRPTSQNHQNSELLTQTLENERLERDRERRQFQETIADLRRRLDQEGEERRKLTALLTHQPKEQQAQPEPKQEGSLLWRKLFGRH